VGIAPKLSDAELVTLAVMQALLGFTSEARWLRHADHHLRHLFPYLPGQSGYNKRLRRAAGLLRHAIRAIATDTALWTDDVWLADSTPVECGRSRETAKRSDLVGWAQYGWCPSHSRWFWGLRLHLVCTLHGLPILFALTGAKAVDREVLADLLTVEPELVAARPGQVLVADKNYYGREFEHVLAGLGVRLLRPARRGETRPARERRGKPLPEGGGAGRHGGGTPAGPGSGCASRCGSWSSRSTTPSKASSTSSSTEVTPPVASGFGSCSASWPSPQRSGTTTTPASPPCAHWSPTTTNPWNRSSRGSRAGPAPGL